MSAGTARRPRLQLREAVLDSLVGSNRALDGGPRRCALCERRSGVTRKGHLLREFARQSHAAFAEPRNAAFDRL
jgi:hypothetical protein